MGFRGLDPSGVDALSVAVREAIEHMDGRARSSVAILGRRAFAREAASLAVMFDRTTRWGNELAVSLVRRADMIRSGQNDPSSLWSLLRARYAVTIGFPEPGFMVEEARRRPAEQASADISRWLEQRWNDWDVTNADLQNILVTLLALEETELSAAVSALSPHQLERWIGEMGNSSNGFSREEKQAVFVLLAAGADGTQLGRVHDAILAAGGEDDLIDLGLAIRAHSPDRAIVEFIRYTVATDLTAHRYASIAPALAIPGIDDATAVTDATRLVAAAAGVLELIISDGMAIARIEDTGTACHPIDPVGSLVATISRSGDPAVIATALGAITTSLLGLDRHNGPGGSSPREKDTAESPPPASQAILLDAATRLLVADPDGVITELATNIDPDGSLTTAFLRELIEADRLDDLSRIVEALRGGEVVDPHRFAEPGAEPGYRYPHAQNLAYLAATLIGGLDQAAENAKSQVQGLGFVASAASALLGGVPGPGGGASLAVAGGEAGFDLWLVGGVQDDIDGFFRQTAAAVELALQPDADNTTAVPESGLAWQAWMMRFRSIRETL